MILTMLIIFSIMMHKEIPSIGMIAAVHTGGGAEAGATNIWSHKWSFGVITGNSSIQDK